MAFSVCALDSAAVCCGVNPLGTLTHPSPWVQPADRIGYIPGLAVPIGRPSGALIAGLPDGQLQIVIRGRRRCGRLRVRGPLCC
jgi:hypothetical protein